eukprot:2028610-Prymnesium_polylepis.1
MCIRDSPRLRTRHGRLPAAALDAAPALPQHHRAGGDRAVRARTRAPPDNRASERRAASGERSAASPLS